MVFGDPVSVNKQWIPLVKSGLVCSVFPWCLISVINPPHFMAGRRDFSMSRVCQITGKRSVSGNNVSHANNRNKRLFKPNLHVRKFWVESENRWVRLRISHKGLRIIDKNGIDAVLKDVRSRGVKV